MDHVCLMPEVGHVLEVRKKKDMGCTCQSVCFRTLSFVLTLLGVTFVGAILWEMGNQREPVTEINSISCYTCESQLNYPRGGNHSGGDEDFSGRLRNSSRHAENWEECLRNPTRIQQCGPGQVCAILHQRLNRVERVVRGCFTGGKLGCSMDTVQGVSETACFCHLDLCIQIPRPADS